MGLIARQSRGISEEVFIESLDQNGLLLVPEGAKGVVIFAQGGGRKRYSTRNRLVAESFYDHKIGSLLFDLLSNDEGRDRDNVFDMELLGDRLDEAKNWLLMRQEVEGLPFGYFGFSTGAGAAIVAAAHDPTNIKAIVTRSGRPDLAYSTLSEIRIPTLLLVGGLDEYVTELNAAAFSQLKCPKAMEIIPRATHSFQEPGTMTEATQIAEDWFLDSFDDL